MNGPAASLMTSLAELRVAAAAWDDLWLRSTTTLPIARAELVAQWVEQFQPAAQFRAVAVEQDGRLVAALPLVEQRLGRVLREATLTGNEWSPCGELLLDPSAGPAAVEALLEAVAELPVAWLWFDGVPAHAPQWQRFATACEGRGAGLAVQPRFDVGWLPIGRDWPAYTASLSRSHRQAMNKVARRLEKAGRVRFQRTTRFARDEIESQLFAGFTVEDCGWKGQAGTSVLRTPDMFAYFVRQAEQLAAWNALDLSTLSLDERPIAFLYGYRGKGVLYTFKIGYDPNAAQFAPGQVLFYKLFEQLHADGEVTAVDFAGPLSEFTARWRPESYPISRLVVAPRRLVGKAALYAYMHWWPRLKRWRGRIGPRQEV